MIGGFVMSKITVGNAIGFLGFVTLGPFRALFVITSLFFVLKGEGVRADTITVYSDGELYNFSVGDANCVPRTDIEFMVAHLRANGARGPVPQLRDSDCYVNCPYQAGRSNIFGIGWSPCLPYDRQVFSGCMAASGTENPNRYVYEDCYNRAVDPSFLDRLRFK